MKDPGTFFPALRTSSSAHAASPITSKTCPLLLASPGSRRCRGDATFTSLASQPCGAYQSSRKTCHPSSSTQSDGRVFQTAPVHRALRAVWWSGTILLTLDSRFLSSVRRVMRITSLGPPLLYVSRDARGRGAAVCGSAASQFLLSGRRLVITVPGHMGNGINLQQRGNVGWDYRLAGRESR